MTVAAVTASTTDTRATGPATPVPPAGDVMAAFLSMLLSIPLVPPDPRAPGEGDAPSVDARSPSPEVAAPPEGASPAPPRALSTPAPATWLATPTNGLPSRLDLGVEVPDAHGATSASRAALVPRPRRLAAPPVSDTPLGDDDSASPAEGGMEPCDAVKPMNPGDAVAPLIGTPLAALESLVVPAAPVPAPAQAPAPAPSPTSSAADARAIAPASPLAGLERGSAAAPRSVPAAAPTAHDLAAPITDLTPPPPHAAPVRAPVDQREAAPRGPGLEPVTTQDDVRADESEDAATPAPLSAPRHAEASPPALMRAIMRATGDADVSSHSGEREGGAWAERQGARRAPGVGTLEATGAAVAPERPAAPVVAASRVEDTRTTPVPVVDQIATRVATMRRDGQQSLSLRLDPPSLGTVHIDAVLDGKQLNVHIRADHAPTRELLDAALPRLKDSLTQQGFHASEVTVQLGLDASPRQFTPERFADAERPLPPPVAPRRAPAVAAPVAPIATGLVDLFV